MEFKTLVIAGGIVVLVLAFLPKLIEIISIFGSLFPNDDEEQVEEVEEIYSPHVRTEFPQNFLEFIGQPRTVENLQISIKVAHIKDWALPHTLLFGLPGLGKTTLAELVAQSMETNFISIEGITLNNKGAVVELVGRIQYKTIVFIDEIHQVNARVGEVLYKMMENFQIDTDFEVIDIPKFTIIGATTDFGLLLKPFRDRFIHQYELIPYKLSELFRIINTIEKVTSGTAKALANISQYTPRLSKNYLKAMREYAIHDGLDVIHFGHYTQLLELKGINEYGLVTSQMRVLNALYTHRKMGRQALAMSAQVSENDLTSMIEPYLVVEGYISRTPNGRQLTGLGESVLLKLKKRT